MPYALGRVYSCNVGPGLGGAHYFVEGDVSGVEDSSDFNWDLCGPCANITAVFIGVSIQGSGENGSRSAGFQPGLGVSLNLFGVSKTRLYGDGWEFVQEDLPPVIKKSYELGLLDREYQPLEKKWVKSPFEAIPVPKMIGF